MTQAEMTPDEQTMQDSFMMAQLLKEAGITPEQFQQHGKGIFKEDNAAGLPNDLYGPTFTEITPQYILTTAYHTSNAEKERPQSRLCDQEQNHERGRLDVATRQPITDPADVQAGPREEGGGIPMAPFCTDQSLYQYWT